MTDDFWPPENYYCVSIKALISDDKGRLLVGRHLSGGYAMPGGGWDHGEDYELCIRREVAEDLDRPAGEADQFYILVQPR